MRACSPLLPAPGGEVVRECLDEIERLQKDAWRYRWLRSREAECNVEIPDRGGYGYELPGYEDELDAAIDAAMAPNATELTGAEGVRVE